MERGDLTGVSPEVLDSLARALQLDEAETQHLHALADAAGPQPARRRKPAKDQAVRSMLQRFLVVESSRERRPGGWTHHEQANSQGR
ncbi:hypothetical protein [Nocardia sp. XZ_19_231]|uniref:hypothetical protein n=1 Tax=Nocardia sp. XZ_19_231 TaxID=2769252 RepID=UPI00351CB10A